MNLPKFTGPGSTLVRRSFWDSIADSVTALQKRQGKHVSATEISGQGTVINVDRKGSVGSPPITGACCFPDGSCLIKTATQCATAGGTYQGNRTLCDPNPCTPECPDISIKLSYNSGTSLLDCKTSGCGSHGGLCWLTDGGGFDHSVCWDITGCDLDDTITLPDDVLKCFTGGAPEIVPLDVEIVYHFDGSNVHLSFVLTASANSCCSFTNTIGTITTPTDQTFTLNTGLTPAVNVQVDISVTGSLC